LLNDVESKQEHQYGNKLGLSGLSMPSHPYHLIKIKNQKCKSTGGACYISSFIPRIVSRKPGAQTKIFPKLW
jgi:hypothetical protein